MERILAALVFGCTILAASGHRGHHHGHQQGHQQGHHPVFGEEQENVVEVQPIDVEPSQEVASVPLQEVDFVDFTLDVIAFNPILAPTLDLGCVDLPSDIIQGEQLPEKIAVQECKINERRIDSCTNGNPPQCRDLTVIDGSCFRCCNACPEGKQYREENTGGCRRALGPCGSGPFRRFRGRRRCGYCCDA